MINIIYEEENNRAVALCEGKIIGECDYIQSENSWNIVHTEVNENYKGQGIARQLVNCIMEQAKKNNVKIEASCSYAQKVIEKSLGK